MSRRVGWVVVTVVVALAAFGTVSAQSSAVLVRDSAGDHMLPGADIVSVRIDTSLLPDMPVTMEMLSAPKGGLAENAAGDFYVHFTVVPRAAEDMDPACGAFTLRYHTDQETPYPVFEQRNGCEEFSFAQGAILDKNITWKLQRNGLRWPSTEFTIIDVYAFAIVRATCSMRPPSRCRPTPSR